MIETTTITLNRKAIFSFVAATLALITFCLGFLPLPFTAILCYPPGFLLSIASLVLGWGAVREIRRNNENGRALALIALWTGGIVLFAIVCFTSAGILLLPRMIEFVQQHLHSARP